MCPVEQEAGAAEDVQQADEAKGTELQESQLEEEEEEEEVPAPSYEEQVPDS